MSQINVNGPSDTGDRTAAAGINLLTVLIVVVLLLAVLWFVFAGPLRGVFFGTRTTNINVNPPAVQQPPNNTNINVNPPAQQPPAQQPPAQQPAP